MSATQLSDGNPDGNTLGQSASDKITFHGKATTNGAQAAFVSANATTAATTTTPWGFTTSTQANKIISDVEAIKTLLINKGFMAAS